ncbi:MAG: sulfotransferase [Flavobacteriales bacterium]|nr:sulfotransferase [Flavobacteriales bacterium]
MSEKSNIDFWGIGAQKGGTSWLYENLLQLKEFSLPPVKEFHYFDRSSDYPSPNFLSESRVSKRLLMPGYLAESLRYLRSNRKTKHLDFYRKWYFSNYDDNWYNSLFERYSDEGLTGEITPSYSILSRDDIKRMYKVSPKAKLVFLMRNPIDRAWSHIRHIRTRDSKSKLNSIEDIIHFFDQPSQELRSDYLSTIDNFTSIFPSEQLLIGYYDAIKENPEQLLRNIVDFISEDKKIDISHLNLTNVVNKSIDVKLEENIHSFLIEKYTPKIALLSERFGGYCTKWLDSIEGIDNSQTEVFSTQLLD